MNSDLKVSIIGLDTSHTIEFTKRLQAPDCPADQHVSGMRVVNCLRFPTPFQSEAGMDKRQNQLESWGVKVVTDFDEAVAGCDVIMIEINDPAYHLEYFKKCAQLGKSIFLDKPLADTTENGAVICKLAEEKGIKLFSSSPLRFSAELAKASETIPNTQFASIYGAIGDAPAGSSIVWYGVHAFEMLQAVMGRGATGVFVRNDAAGAIAIVEYGDGRRGVVELTTEMYFYGGCLRDAEKGVTFEVDFGAVYTSELKEIVEFFKSGKSPVGIADTMEVMALLCAADRSSKSGRLETL